MGRWRNVRPAPYRMAPASRRAALSAHRRRVCNTSRSDSPGRSNRIAPWPPTGRFARGTARDQGPGHRARHRHRRPGGGDRAARRPGAGDPADRPRACRGDGAGAARGRGAAGAPAGDHQRHRGADRAQGAVAGLDAGSAAAGQRRHGQARHGHGARPRPPGGQGRRCCCRR